MKGVVIALLGATILFFVVSCEVSLWDECRSSGHSWYYCSRVLGK